MEFMACTQRTGSLAFSSSVNALGLGHLLDNQTTPFGGLLIQVSQDVIQLTRQKQRLIKDGSVGFQVFSM